MPTFAATAAGYSRLWASMRITPARAGAVAAIARRLQANRARYAGVAATVGAMPWWWVAAVHELESGARFDRHLHNGDPLTARTRQVPAGRPAAGAPPFTWEASALDALRLHGLQNVAEWTIARALYEFERYNGWGYFGKIASPYVWSFSNHYLAGKYVADHVFDPAAVSAQCGAAVIAQALGAVAAVTPAVIGSDLFEPVTKTTPAAVPEKQNFLIDLWRWIRGTR